jgi:DNA processing protein
MAGRAARMAGHESVRRAVDDAESWLRLCLLPELTPGVGRRLLSRFGTPQEVLAAKPAALVPIAGAEVASALARGPSAQALDTALAWLGQTGNHLVTLADAHYPAALLQIADPPLILYASGRMELLGRPALAVVGSRNPTPAGAADAESFAQVLADAGLTIVSGLALGIDAAAHRGGLRGAASSVAVVGTGLDRVYPARNRDLAHALANHGLLTSEFPLGTPPVASNFPRRNRIISGLSRGCLIVEAAVQSGSLITARQALEQGREVFAVPGSIHSPLSKGCHWLIKQGAKLVESAQDVLEELQLAVPAAAAARESFRAPAPQEAALLAALGFDPVDLDTLCARTGLTPDAASAMLLTLELDGYLDHVPGGLYQRRR